MANRDSLPPEMAPTRVRYGVLGFVAALSMITYLDRACMGSAKSWIVHDLGLSGPEDLGLVFGAFGFAYALFEVPSGWLGDVFGPRSVLLRIVLWWSLFTGLTGLVGLSFRNWALSSAAWLGVLVVLRFLFGMGEAGAYPNITRALHNWFPFTQRGVTQGTVWMSGRLMGGLTPMIWALLVPTVEQASGVAYGPVRWRIAFWVFAAIGLVWCLCFALWFRNRPEDHPRVNAAERELIRAGGAGQQAAHSGVPWRKFLTSRNLWFLGLMYFCQSFGWYFYMTYLPGFMRERYGLEQYPVLRALSEGGPLWVGAIGCLMGGVATDWLIRRTGNRRLGRKLFGIIGHGLTAVCFLLCPHMPGPISFFVVISLSGFFTDLTMGSSWASCQDIGRRYAAMMAGFMNMIGNLGGALGPVATAWVLKWSLAGQALTKGVAVEKLSEADKHLARLVGYDQSFYLFAAVFVVGTLSWLFIDATKPVTED